MSDRLKPDILLSKTEYQRFIRNGYLLLPGAIEDNQLLDQLEKGIDKIDSDFRRIGWDPYRQRKLGKNNNFIYPNFIDLSKSFLELTTYPTVFHKVWGILGWNIYCYYSDLVVTPPWVERDKYDTIQINDWHRDSGRVNWETNGAQLSVKVVYFLSDCESKLMGNLCVVPRSHREDIFHFGKPQSTKGETVPYISQRKLKTIFETDVEGVNCAKPILAKRGDALIFDRRLWHSRSENLSEVTRKVLFYGYAYRWMAGHTYNTLLEAEKIYGEKLPPILQQMLGNTINADNAYYPSEEDVPLRKLVKRYESNGELAFI